MRGHVGQVELIGLPDTPLVFPLKAMYPSGDLGGGVAFEDLLTAEYLDPQTGLTTMPVTAWLLRTPDAVVLVDTGSGDLPAPGMEELHPGWPASTSPLIANLAAAGVAPDDVDLVVCTHVHPDHVGGHTTTVADRFVPTFPNARYVLPRAEYERAAEEAADPDTPTMFVRLFTDRVQPLLDAGVADLVDGVHPVTPEIRMRPAAGHTPGQMRVDVHSDDALAILCADVVHFPFEITHPEIASDVSDHDPALAALTRGALLAECADRDALLVTTHLRAPAAGRVRRDGERFAFDPGWPRR